MRRPRPQGLQALALVVASAALILGACNGDGEDTSDSGEGGSTAPTPAVTEVASPTSTPTGTGTGTGSPAPPAAGSDGAAGDAAGGGIEPATPDAPPEGTLTSGGGSVPLGLGTYCWSPPTGSGNLGLCADAVGIITAPDDLMVSPGETLTIEGEAGTLPWPPMTIARATLYPASDEPVDERADWRAWHPQETAISLETVEEVGTHSVTLPADLEPGQYVLELSYTAGPDSGSDAIYGAVLTVE